MGGDSRKRAEPILRWKYSVRCPDESEHERPVSKPNAEVYEDDFLYDLRADPWKQTTLISAPNFRDIVTAMRKRLIARMTSIGEYKPRVVDAPNKRTELSDQRNKTYHGGSKGA